MKLGLRFVAAIAATAVIVMATHYYVVSRNDEALFDADHAQDMQVMEALEATLEAIIQKQGTSAALDALEEVNRRSADAKFRFVTLTASVGEIERVDLPPAAHAAVLRNETTSIMRPDATGVMRLFTYLPIKVNERIVGALELSESMVVQDTQLFRRRIVVLLTTLILLILLTVLVTAIGFYAVARPLQLVRDRARGIASGDLKSRLGLRRRDEIGQLAEEFDTMCDRIVEERLRIATETEERIASLEQLRHTDRLTTMGQLASGVAHELGTPLNVIALRAKMVEGAGVTPEVASNARVIQEQATRMTGIIRQLLDFSRRQGPKLGLVKLREIVARTLDLLAPLIDKTGVTVDIEAPDELLFVRVDQNQMQQALTNIVMNGIQAMPQGGCLRVRLASANTRPPDDPESPEAEYVSITVTDEGPGIPRESLRQVFEPFFTTKGVGEGTGLGLAVAYGIIKEHGGWIDVESEPGAGSRFTIWLLRAAAASERAVDTAS